ncbi:MAG: hypothetical protein M3O35_03905 [Acidobacteriota bacterium]|nr:hypothetical protein [Acidobacteriota bacterium]
MLQFLIILLCLTLPALAKSPFAGTWEGSMHDQPALKLTIEDTAGKLTGTMVFYFQQRGEDGRFHVVPNGDAAGAIISPQVEGKILTFEVHHHKKHGGTELGPNIKYNVELTGANEARLRQAGDAKAGEGLKLIRQTP